MTLKSDGSIKMFHKLLVTLDGSQLAEAVLPYLTEFVRTVRPRKWRC